MQKQHNNIWWGPPREFSNQVEERKISWLELFFDLVYAVVISRTTHGLAVNNTTGGILDYAYLIIIVFWGWYNGSQYYDLHGTTGIRTRLMTLWQMMAVAALAVTLYSSPDKAVGRATIAIALLQFFITYLWWSVGIYDKKHRKYNIPYTVCYLIAFGLIIATLFVPQPYKRLLFWITLVLNYLPPFIASKILKRHNSDFSLSPSMIERLGLFTIIVFGEAILGVVNGLNLFGDLTLTVWLCFGLGILIVFSLWWIFFSLIADRQSQNGLAKGTV
ncbi:MAG TPA: low temperature requirement protein A, partial [Mucilaginibacter sp.]|nr:low temperature requirement protein A [Mucilaginibacter sp.]